MFNEQDILARLKKGEKVDDIAQEVIDMVNKANKTYENEKAQEAKKQAQQQADMRTVLRAIENYLNTYYPTSNSALVNAENIQKAIKAVDEVMTFADSVSELSKTLGKKYGDLAPKAKMTEMNSDDILFNFLKDHNW